WQCSHNFGFQDRIVRGIPRQRHKGTKRGFCFARSISYNLGSSRRAGVRGVALRRPTTPFPPSNPHTRGSGREEIIGFMRKLKLLVVVLGLFPVGAFSQPGGWNDPFPPHHVMDNVYFVGTKELASFLITTPQGHILMNS